MKKHRIFIIGLFVSLVAISGVYFGLFALADKGKIDNFYLKFTTERQRSLVLGSSRAAQGIRPSFFNEQSLSFEGPLFNFAFTGAHSPYGPAYLRAIMKKLDPETRNGLFILEVNPYDISVRGDETEELRRLREMDDFLCELHLFNLNPNIEYILTQLRSPFLSLTSAFLKGDRLVVREDGWLEVNVSMEAPEVERRKELRIGELLEDLQGVRFSELRLDYLGKTVRFLRQYGKVVLVRLPVDPEVLKTENERIPQFNEKMERLASTEGVRYIDFTRSPIPFETTDGQHLSQESSAKISTSLLCSVDERVARQWPCRPSVLGSL